MKTSIRTSVGNGNWFWRSICIALFSTTVEDYPGFLGSISIRWSKQVLIRAGWVWRCENRSRVAHCVSRDPTIGTIAPLSAKWLSFIGSVKSISSFPFGLFGLTNNSLGEDESNFNVDPNSMDFLGNSITIMRFFFSLDIASTKPLNFKLIFTSILIDVDRLLSKNPVENRPNIEHFLDNFSKWNFLSKIKFFVNFHENLARFFFNFNLSIFKKLVDIT